VAPAAPPERKLLSITLKGEGAAESEPAANSRNLSLSAKFSAWLGKYLASVRERPIEREEGPEHIGSVSSPEGEESFFGVDLSETFSPTLIRTVDPTVASLSLDKQLHSEVDQSKMTRSRPLYWCDKGLCEDSRGA
jgi:hypothetical protein